MQILSKKLLKVYPAVPTEQKVLYLASPDHFVRPKYVSLLLLFAEQQDETEVIPLHHLTETLSKLLVQFYPLAGRLRRREDKKLELVCNDEGVEFIEIVVDANMKDIDISGSSSEYSHLLDPSPNLSGDSIFKCPLLYVQSTRFKCGGSALVISLVHTALDGMSVGHFTTSWSEIATGKELTRKPFHNRMLLKAKHDSHNLLFQPPELRVVLQEAPPAPSLQPRCLPPAERIFTFSPEQLKKIKSKASKDNDRGQCSTFESINAHVWRSITKCRGLEFCKKTKFLTTLDVRKRVKPNLPEGYVGNAICFVSATATVGDLLHKPLSFAANRIQDAISSFTEAHLQSIFAWVEQQEGTIVMNVNAGDNAGQDVAVSSWIRMRCYELDFGSGNPKFVGPCSNPYDGNVIMLPSHKGEGYLNIFAALDPRHMQALEQDSEFLLAGDPSEMLIAC